MADPKIEERRLKTVRLAAAALKYCAVADFFEGPSCCALKEDDPRTRRVWGQFNRVEAELREAAGTLLRERKTSILHEEMGDLYGDIQEAEVRGY